MKSFFLIVMAMVSASSFAGGYDDWYFDCKKPDGTVFGHIEFQENAEMREAYLWDWGTPGVNKGPFKLSEGSKFLRKAHYLIDIGKGNKIHLAAKWEFFSSLHDNDYAYSYGPTFAQGSTFTCTRRSVNPRSEIGERMRASGKPSVCYLGDVYREGAVPMSFLYRDGEEIDASVATWNDRAAQVAHHNAMAEECKQYEERGACKCDTTFSKVNSILDYLGR